jgi:dolichol-phosphate mannosyltransferase
MAELDIVIPVYNEKAHIVSVMEALRKEVRTPFRVLICYDFEEDDTLQALAGYERPEGMIEFVRNQGRGAHAAVRSGLAATDAPLVLIYMADDDYNAGLIDRMAERVRNGCDLVAASRFARGGTMEGCRWHKALPTVVAAFTLRHFARLPVHDSTNSFRMFSRRLIDAIEIESRIGFTFSIELLVKAHRLGWPTEEIAARWMEREDKPSRFRTFRWMPAYFRWYFYAFATTWLRRGPGSVRVRDRASP